MFLATDLDGTFLAGSTEDRLTLYQLIESNHDIQLVFVTGRGLESVLPILADPMVPRPDYIICDVGATIVDGEHQQPIQPLQSDIEHQWPGEHIVLNALNGFDRLVRQDVPQQRRCSFYINQDELEPLIPDLIEIANQIGCDVIYSVNRYLDYLPKGVNKGSSVQALVNHLNINHKRILVAGDSLNDLQMYLQSSWKGVCVGDSEPALYEATKNKDNVLHSNRLGCGGILEAIEHFELLNLKELTAGVRPKARCGKSELVIVYHRLPYDEVFENGKCTQQQPKSPNGIIPTLLSFFGPERAGAWIAWSIVGKDKTAFQRYTAVNKEQYPNLVCSRVDLTKNEVDIFYKRFSKEAFWPLLHTFWERATFNEDHWSVYVEVNRRFAQHAAEESAEGALVWIHDYNLWLVPAFLRELRPDLKIAFFHHTYFPSADIFNVVPWRHQIIGSLLQCDYIGFHIPRQVENFIDVALGVMPLNILEREGCAPRFLTYGCAVGLDQVTKAVEVNGRRIELGAHPVGIDLNRIKKILDKSEQQEKIEHVRSEWAGTKVILSVERLDYTKGLLEKIIAFEKLLEIHPESHEKITLVAVCVPAAQEIQVYQDLKIQIEQAVGRINGRFSKLSWVPVKFFYRSLPFEDLVGYYANADIMWITPLRDGLNLVAKEYVATQGILHGHGKLVLSEFAGVAAELRGAILTNPHDRHDMVQKCWQAINMEDAEAQDRLREMFSIVEYNDIDRWGREFLSSVELAVQRQQEYSCPI
ncbi:MAG: glucosylglycerol-phosphate synthase [Pseudomonadota bacterium]